MNDEETLQAILEEVIDRQLIQNQQPEISQTYNRLINRSYSHGEAKNLIVKALGIELYRLMHYEEPFDKLRFMVNLNQLPNLPDADMPSSELL